MGPINGLTIAIVIFLPLAVGLVWYGPLFTGPSHTGRFGKAALGSRIAELAFQARTTSYEDRTVAHRIALRIESAVWSQRARRRPSPSPSP